MTTFLAQGTFIVPIEYRKGKFLFIADRWNKNDLEDSRYIWLPLFISGAWDRTCLPAGRFRTSTPRGAICNEN
ncbi:MAG TPA: hypothetical protein VGO09_11910 [Flavisolibacter sp.]|nr:hypothetical protein [Flavisolibacter sp.]